MNAADRYRQLAERWFEEGRNERGDETIDELMAPGGTGHFEGGDAGVEGFKAIRAAMLSAFPDLQVTVEDRLAHGSDVVVRWRLRGTHAGGGLTFPASDQTVDVTGMTWLRFEDGRIVEGWDSWNQGAFLESILPGAEARGGAAPLDAGSGDALDASPRG